MSELFFSGRRRSAEPKTYGRLFFFRKGLNTHLVRTLFLFFLVLQVPRSTRNFFFFLPRCQNVYDIAGSFSHAWLTKQRKWLFRGNVFSPLTIARHLLKSRIEGNESGEYSRAETSGH